MNIFDAFNETRTTNGDRAYKRYIGNPYVDFLFRLQKIREIAKYEGLVEVEKLIFTDYPEFLEQSEFNRFFSMYIRDPRMGIGEREIGRVLLKIQNISIDDVIEIGRADDILFTHTPKEVVGYIKEAMDNDSIKDNYQLLKKWLPRERSKKFKIIRNELRRQKISKTIYRGWCASPMTVEAVRSRGEFPDDYSHVPSLSMLRHKKEFFKDENFKKYLEELKSGKTKINQSVSTPYDLLRSYRNTAFSGYDYRYTAYDGKINPSENGMEHDTFYTEAFKALGSMNLGKIIPIIDGSGSMFDRYDSIGKARSIGHYVARHSDYLPNHFIVFSDDSRIMKLTKDEDFSYVRDMAIMESFGDCTNTNFEAVLRNLNNVTEDLPEYVLVLSDMQFDDSYDRNATHLDTLNQKGVNMIWWNLSVDNVTLPTVSKDGNVFVSGYSPQILSILSGEFDAESYVTKLIEDYKKKRSR